MWPLVDMGEKMTLTKQSLEELKKKARAATKGRWRWIDRYDFREHKEHQDQGLEADCENIEMGRIKLVSGKDIILEEWLQDDSDTGLSIAKDDAKFIETASPDVILDLIARVEELSEALQEIIVRNCFHGESKTFCTCIAKSAIESFGVK